MPGYEEAHRELEAWRRRRREAALDCVRRVGNDLLGAAVPLAPLREGFLRQSGQVDVYDGEQLVDSSSLAGAPESSPAEHEGAFDVESIVSFNLIYAARQHEELEWEHNEGQAKYLEAPFKARIGRYDAALARSVEQATRGG